jgi:hypothetical protein
MSTKSRSRYAGCSLPVGEGVQLVVGLRAENAFGGPKFLELGEVAAPCHPSPACVEAASQGLNPDRHLARALQACQATDDWDHLRLLLEE